MYTVSMNKMLLNAIIGISILGISIIGIKDYLTTKIIKDNTQMISAIPTQPVISVQPVQNSPVPAECVSDYFPFKQGKTWNYSLVSDTVNEKGKKVQTSQTISAKLAAVATGSATLQLQLSQEKNARTTKLLCYTDGIYLDPASLLTASSDTGVNSTSGILNMLKLEPFLLLPSDANLLHQNSTWTSQIKAGINLGFFNQSFQLPLTSTVIEQNAVKKTITVQSVADFKKIGFDAIAKDSQLKIIYELQQNVGLKSATVEAKISTFIDKKIKAVLK